MKGSGTRKRSHGSARQYSTRSERSPRAAGHSIAIETAPGISANAALAFLEQASHPALQTRYCLPHATGGFGCPD